MRRFIFLLCLTGLLLPVTSSIAQDDCDNGNYLETRFFGGDAGRVTLGGSANRVRAEPSTGGEEIFQIPPGHIFYVNYTSSVCSEGIVWREITYLDRVGWTAESYLAVSPDYFIEPLDLVQTINETITLEGGATALAFSPDSTQLTMVLPDNSLARFDLLDRTERIIPLNSDEPILNLVYHPDDSGIYATIHEYSVNIWNSNHALIRRIESRMLPDYPSVFELDHEWEFLANGGCFETDDSGCIDGSIILIDPDSDEEIILLGNRHPESVRDIDIMSRPYTTPGGFTDYEAIMLSVSEHTRAIANLRTGLHWQGSAPVNSSARLNTVASTLEYGVTLYGGCKTFDAGRCTEGYLRAISFMSGGTHSNFDTMPAEILDVEMSDATYPNRMRAIALGANGIVYVIDFSHQDFEVETLIQTFDDIPAQAFAISPDGSVLAITSNEGVILYDISVSN